MRKKEEPKHIIVIDNGMPAKYVLFAPFGPDNVRKPVFTSDVEKAIRFYDEKEAQDYYTRFLPVKNRKYKVETFEGVKS
jgi:hypothetical protein